MTFGKGSVRRLRRPHLISNSDDVQIHISRRSRGDDSPVRLYGNKDVALKLGARYGSTGWFAPPGVDLSQFEERGWL